MDSENRGVSVYIAAQDADDARNLFEKCMELAATGKHFNGELVYDRSRENSGCAQLFTDLPQGSAR